ncbi:hypothetical protein HDU67_005090, partial [Dinochytrium kinnereticum]
MQRVGERQVKIRGPVGRRFLGSIGVPESVPRSGFGSVPKEILFLAGGTGLTPCLQLINYLLLPLHQSQTVTGYYDPTAPDELELRPGDQVVPYHHFMDGWSRGINRTTGLDGAFPLSLTHPPCRPDFKITVLASVRSAADACGMDVLRAAELAYPDFIEVHWAVGLKVAAAGLYDDGGMALVDVGEATMVRTREGLGCGVVHHGVLDVGLLGEILGGSQAREMGRAGSVETLEGEVGPLVVVCGPDAYTQVALACVRESQGLRPGELVVLGAEG